MATSRAQLEKQIQNLEDGGALGIKAPLPSIDSNVQAALDVDLSKNREKFGMPSQQQEIVDLMEQAQRAARANSSSSRPSRSKEIMEYLKPPSYEEGIQKYRSRLEGLYEPSPRPGFYDLASELGRAMLSGDPTAGVFRSAGVGFSNFNGLLKQSDAENLKNRRAVGIEAAKMAMEDERKAQDRLRDFAVSVYENENLGEIDPSTLQYDEKDENGEFTGQRITNSFDKKSDYQQILKILRTQNGTDVEALPDMLEATPVDKLLAKEFVTEYGKISALAGTTGYAKLDTIAQAKILAENIGEENFGKVNEWTLPIKQFVLDLAPWAADMAGIDEAAVGSQEALSALTISFVLANVAQTKGAVSNSEMGLFKEASPYLGQTYAGFMLALQVQELAARKAIDYSSAYKAEAKKYMQENPRDQGAGISGHMGEWSTEWQNSTQSSFLDDDMKARIAEYEAKGRKKIGSGVFSVSSYENKQKEFSNRKMRENQQSVNSALQTTQALIDQILKDPDLTADQKVAKVKEIQELSR